MPIDYDDIPKTTLVMIVFGQENFIILERPRCRTGVSELPPAHWPFTRLLVAMQ
jgi:hypothetical protein